MLLLGNCNTSLQHFGLCSRVSLSVDPCHMSRTGRCAGDGRIHRSLTVPPSCHALQVQTCWDTAVRSAGGLAQRRAAVEEFNGRSRFRKRGLAATPTKFGIAFTAKFLNQVRARAGGAPQAGGLCTEPKQLLT